MRITPTGEDVADLRTYWAQSMPLSPSRLADEQWQIEEMAVLMGIAKTTNNRTLQSMIDSHMVRVPNHIAVIVYELASLAMWHEMDPCEVLNAAGLSHGFPLAVSI